MLRTPRNVFSHNRLWKQAWPRLAPTTPGFDPALSKDDPGQGWAHSEFILAEAGPRDWSENHRVAILGSGGNFHYAQLSYVPLKMEYLKRRPLPNPKWAILEDAGVKGHLHAACQTGFWSPGWTLIEVGTLRALSGLNKVPYMACMRCNWPLPTYRLIQEEEALLTRALTEVPS